MTTSAPARLPARLRRDRQLWRRWALATMPGELVGFLAPALAGPVVADAPGRSDRGVVLPALAALVVAGAVEGAALGYVQWRVLREVLPAIRAGQWGSLRWRARWPSASPAAWRWA